MYLQLLADAFIHAIGQGLRITIKQLSKPLREELVQQENIQVFQLYFLYDICYDKKDAFQFWS